jgi:hypothetical protein
MTRAGGIKAAALVGVVAAALVPLYGDPRQTPVTHAEWARMLLRAMGMDDAARSSHNASQVFGALAWKDSLAYNADRFAEGNNVRKLDGGTVVAEGGAAELAYPVAVVQRGDYRLRMRIKGDPNEPASIELTPAGKVQATRTFPVVPPAVSGWVDAGTTYLSPGPYSAKVVLPPGAQLDGVEVTPPCVNAIEPPGGGWQPTAVTTAADVAVTALKALDRESELPPAALPIEVTGQSFESASGTQATPAAAGNLDQLWLRAGPTGLQAVVFVDVPADGLYTVSSFGVAGAGQSWVGDSCRKTAVCGARAKADDGTPQWRALMTSDLTAGRHLFTVTLGSGAGVERLRLELRKNSPQDYVAALKRLGFDPGPDGPVTRAKATEAASFVAQKLAEQTDGDCGDVGLDANVQVADAGGEPGPITPPVIPPITPGIPEPPIGPPVIPPQPPGSPDQP